MRSSRKATADTPAGATQAAIRTWVAQETASGRRATRPLVVLGMVQIALAVAQAWCVALVLGRAIASAAAGGGYGAAAWMPLFGFTAASVLRAAVQFAATTRAAATGADQRRRLRSTALGQMLDAGPTLLRGRATGALVATLVDQVEQLDGFFARWLPAASLAMFGPLLVLAVLAPIDRQACLVLLATGCAVPVLQAVFGIGAARASRRQFTALARLQVRFLDRVRGVGTLVLAGAIEHEAEAMQDAADELRRRTMRILRVAFASSAALDCAFVVALVLVAIADRHALLDRNSAPAVARALFALLLVAEFFAPLRAFALAYQDKHRIVAAAEDFSRLPPARAPAAPPGPVRTVDASGVTVAFERVSFAWDAQRGSVLSDLSFRVTPGETALLVGPSGAGKSTVLELLLGFATPSSGKITVNGAELASIVPQALSAMTAWIGQKPMLFAGTIGENIRFARPDASAAELDDAIRAARLDSLLRDLPDGVRTRIGEGGYGLSGGQAQRIAVARAFLKDAPLLLLDEPTAHLDPATEREVFESLRRLALGRTVLLASHSAAATAFGGRRIELGQTPPLRSALSEVGA